MLLLLLTIVMMDQSLCLSCTFELPGDASGDGDPGGDCSLCLTLAQPVELALFQVEFESSVTQRRMEPTAPDSFLPPVFHPPQPSAGR